MSGKAYIPVGIRRLVKERAQHRCEYCQDHSLYAASAFHIDHIVAEQHGGETVLANLALACGPCNLLKGPNLVTMLPGSRDHVSLFHPRKDVWKAHFVLREDGLFGGRTLEALATIQLLKLNATEKVEARKLMLVLGLF